MLIVFCLLFSIFSKYLFINGIFKTQKVESTLGTCFLLRAVHVVDKKWLCKCYKVYEDYIEQAENRKSSERQKIVFQKIGRKCRFV